MNPDLVAKLLLKPNVLLFATVPITVTMAIFFLSRFFTRTCTIHKTAGKRGISL